MNSKRTDAGGGRGLDRIRPVVGVLGLIVILAVPRPGAGEGFADIYMGFSRTEAEDNAYVVDGANVRNLDGTDSSTDVGGGRIGYWFQSLPWVGVALDMSTFEPVFDDATVLVTPASALLMLRAPLLKSGDFPEGRVQPYLAGGPAFFFTAISESTGTAVPPPAILSDSSIDPGFDARAGVTVLIYRPFGLFFEYRYTRVRPELKDGAVRYEPDFKTQHAVLGVTFRFGVR
jgi:hypothetical protein